MDERQQGRNAAIRGLGNSRPAAESQRPVRFSIWLTCVAVLLCAAVFRVSSNGQSIHVAGNESLVIPETCLFVRWFNTRCAGCGLTRGVIRTIQGDFHGGMRYHPAAVAVAGFVAFHFVFQGYWLVKNINPPAAIRQAEVISFAVLFVWIACGRTAVAWLQN